MFCENVSPGDIELFEIFETAVKVAATILIVPADTRCICESVSEKARTLNGTRDPFAAVTGILRLKTTSVDDPVPRGGVTRTGKSAGSLLRARLNVG
jgi:hypothetical protein